MLYKVQIKPLKMKTKTKPILGFQDEYRFLSNFWEVYYIYLDGQVDPYLSVENAYQASKTLDYSLREEIRTVTQGKAKKLGQALVLRPDWNDDLRIQTMRSLLTQKFDGRDIELVQKLIATGDAKIIGANTWGDTFFGVCDNKGKNYLGKLLMEIRKKLSDEKEIIEKVLKDSKQRKVAADRLNISERKLNYKIAVFGLQGFAPLPLKSENWDAVLQFTEQNPGKKIEGFPGSVRFPTMYGGQEYEIIASNGQKYTARVDDSREFMSEGLEWKTLGKNRMGNVEQYYIVAWKLIEKS